MFPVTTYSIHSRAKVGCRSHNPWSTNFTQEKYKNIGLNCYDVVGSVVYSNLCIQWGKLGFKFSTWVDGIISLGFWFEV